MNDYRGNGFRKFAARVVAFAVLLLTCSATHAVTEMYCRINEDNTTTNTGCEKDDPGQSCEFSITYDQEVEWQGNADYSYANECGNDFKLEVVGSNPPKFVTLTENLPTSDPNPTFLLPPARYRVAWREYGVGPGTYRIWYNREARLKAAPDLDFGSIDLGDFSPTKIVTISNEGREHDYTITVTGILPEGYGFTITPQLETPFDLPPARSQDVGVKCKTDSTGNYSATLTVTGTWSSTNQTTRAAVNLQCNIKDPKPVIACAVNPNDILGMADWCEGETSVVSPSFKNTGTGPLILTGISLAGQAGSPFSLQTIDPDDLSPLPPGESRAVPVLFAPKTEGIFQDAIVIVSNDLETPILSCPFKAKGHHPAPKPFVQNSINFGDVQTGVPVYQSTIISNAGQEESKLHIQEIEILGNAPFYLEAPVGETDNIPSCVPGETILENGHRCQIWVKAHTQTPPPGPQHLTGNIAVTWGKDGYCENRTQTIPLSANIAPGIAKIEDTSGNARDRAVRFGYTSQGVLPPNCPRGSAEVRVFNIGIDPLQIGNIGWGPDSPSGLRISDDRCSGRQLRNNGHPCSLKIVWDDFPWARNIQQVICPGRQPTCKRKSSRSAGGKAQLLVPTNDPTQRQPIVIAVTTPSASCIKMTDCRCGGDPGIPGGRDHKPVGEVFPPPPHGGGLPIPCDRPPCPGLGPLTP